MFEIRKDIPVPTDVKRKAGARLYPFANMVAGDSFVVPKGFKASPTQEADEPEVLARKITNAARGFGRKNGCQFHVAVAENGDVTCWMTEKTAETGSAQ